jgi:hypothetical protein
MWNHQLRFFLEYPMAMPNTTATPQQQHPTATRNSSALLGPTGIQKENLTMPVAEALTSLKLGFQLESNVAGITKQAFDKLVVQDASLGNVYKKVRELMDQRAILCDSDGFAMRQRGETDQTEPVQSPIVDGLINLYSQSHPAPQGVIYVMYAPAGQGKTFGARSVLEHFYAFPGEGDKCVKGFMLTGQALDKDYMSELSAHLGATAVKGWVHALLLAMNEPGNLEPSLLIPDGFNSLGEDNVNEGFIKTLYGLMNAKKNMIVVISTQEETVANKLCSLNGGQRIAPLPGTYTGKETSPTWNGMNWSRDLLIEAVRYKFTENFPMNHEFDFIVGGMTPLQAIKAALLSLRHTGKGEPPGSPKKKKSNLK